jgi:hypothetical protein
MRLKAVSTVVTMKRFMAAVLACGALGAWGQDITRDQYEKLSSTVAKNACKATPDDAATEIRGLLSRFETNYYFGKSALAFLKEKKYKDLSIFDLAMHYCIELPKPLGTIERWRYESCQTDAAKAPTSQGVAQGMRVCREKFNQ